MSSGQHVVTRFAPSPTGFLHIGGARTALFNWMFARRHGGKYLLRIEDTDRARSTQEAIDAILAGLAWLGLDTDEPPLFQSTRAARHQQAAHEMIKRGGAFRCYATDAEVEALRNEARAEGRAMRSPYRSGDIPATDRPFVVRLKAPDDDVVNSDLVQGDVRIRGRDIDDLILLRSDGTPTYMLAVVVDDHDMGVTHVIRGDDHLTNAARQIAIYSAAGWDAPRFAHIPLIHGPDGAKLSKRHGALGVEAYRDEMGYLPEGLAAYLIRLGWSPGHDDILSKEEAAEVFDLSRVVKAPARLDFNKLANVNAHFLKRADDARLAGLTRDFIAANKPDWTIPPAAPEKIRAAIPILKQRSKTIAELAEMSFFFLASRPLQLDAAAQKALTGEARARLQRLHPRLQAHAAWDASALAAELKDFVAAEGVGMGQLGPPLRAALSGGAPAPDLGQALALLGREEALARLEDQF
ncbi:MAG: glutamate--tRNA ligase [Hyphomonadaceae bacterium]|nr:glutamate--tRNA ligase [Hyphomonadaceae bacterium]